MKKAEAQNREDSLAPLRLRKLIEEVENVPRIKRVHGGQGDTGDPFKINQTNVQNAIPVAHAGWEDSLLVVHPSPNAGSTKARGIAGHGSLTSDEKYGIVRYGNVTPLMSVGGSPKAESSKLLQAKKGHKRVKGATPKPARRRWGSGQLTMRDVVLFLRAVVFAAAAFLMILLGFRVLMMGLQIVRGTCHVFRALTSF